MSLENKIRNNYTFVEAEEILTFIKKFNLYKIIQAEAETIAQDIYDGNTEV